MSDAAPRRRVHRHFAETGEPPKLDRASARRLGFVLDEEGRILIESPFAGRPTAYRVEAGRRFRANCVRDALGILALLGRDGTADCEGIDRVRRLERTAFHAQHWYDDLAHT